MFGHVPPTPLEILNRADPDAQRPDGTHKDSSTKPQTRLQRMREHDAHPEKWSPAMKALSLTKAFKPMHPNAKAAVEQAKRRLNLPEE